MVEETFVGYQKDEDKRKALNALMESTFHFSFEPWYQTGYWNADYKPYSLFEGDQLIANIGAYRMHLILGRRHYTALQIGAVTSIEAYRGKHRVSVLFETLFRENMDVDFFFLYSEETAVNFYPRFGFVEKKAFFTEKEITKNSEFSFRKLDYEKDFAQIERMAKYGTSAARLRMENDVPLRFFCLPFYKDQYYFDESRSVMVLAQKEKDKYILNEIWSINTVDAETVAGSFIQEEKALVSFHFLPHISGGTMVEDTTRLFVRANKNFDITNFMVGPIIRT